jgi:hypothetical protein
MSDVILSTFSFSSPQSPKLIQIESVTNYRNLAQISDKSINEENRLHDLTTGKELDHATKGTKTSLQD